MRIILIIGILVAGLLLSCTKDKFEVPTEQVGFCDSLQVNFVDHIQPIINQNCAFSGCHGSGSQRGDYTSFEGVKIDADNGKINNRVLVIKDMPPGNPLSTEDLEIISCWLEDGAPEN